MTGSKWTLLLASGLAAILCCDVAHAQQLATDADSASSDEEILVTARKRQESVMNVPIVTTAIGQAQIERFNMADLKAITARVPGLSFGSSFLSVGTVVSLRGVGTSALDPGVDASVALNIDGMALSQGLAYASGMFDIGQIEVLKGPQSLFYGKSSPGGVISLRTADPTDQFELVGRAGYEVEARERRIEAIISGPLTESLKLRLAGTYGKQSGFFKNDAVAIPALGAAGPSRRRMGTSKDYKLRGTALFSPSSDFDMRLKINRVVDDSNYAGTVQLGLCPDGVGPFNGRQFVDPNDKCKIDRHASSIDYDPAAFPGVPNNGVPYNRTKQTYGTAELNVRIQPGLLLTSHTGYYLVNASSLYNATTAGAGAGLFNAINRFQRRQFTQEARLVSDFSTPLNFTLGAYLERGRFYDKVTIGGNRTLGVPAVLQQGNKIIHVKAESVFGQLLYRIVPEVELAAGARWTSERRSQDAFNSITGTSVPVVTAVPKISSRNVAPEISLTYRPNGDLTIFGSLKRGYKSGSYNVSTPPFVGENNAFGDEKVQGGELGLKARSADRRLSFNTAAFYYKYSGLQVGANVQMNGGVSATRTINAGAARSFGIEADISYRPEAVDGLSLHAAVLWNDTKYTKLLNIPCFGGQLISEGCNLLFSPTANGGAGGFTAQDRSGVPLVRAAKLSGSFGFEYEMPVGNELRFVLANNNQYQSRSLVNLGLLFYQKAYIKTDLSLTLKGGDDRWELALIGKNLANEITTGNCANSNRAAGNSGGLITGSTMRGAAGSDEIGCLADRGRELWLRATLRY